MWKSLKEYVTALGYWSVYVPASVVGTATGLYIVVSGNDAIPIPGWLWIASSFLIALVAPFIVFHKQRLSNVSAAMPHRDAVIRSIAEVQVSACNLITRKQLLDAQRIAEETMDEAYERYKRASDELWVERQVADNARFKAAVEPFTTFVGFHVVRILGGVDTRFAKDLEIDEWHVIGKIAVKADEAIAKVREIASR